MAEHKKHIAFQGKILILGFGAVGQGTLPQRCATSDAQRERLGHHGRGLGAEIADEYGVAFRVEPVTRDTTSAFSMRHSRLAISCSTLPSTCAASR
jgi:homospermidine synthase